MNKSVLKFFAKVNTENLITKNNAGVFYRYPVPVTISVLYL